MATWQFWTLFTVLLLILITANALLEVVKGLRTKLQDLQQAIGSLPRLDYREDLERLERRLEGVRQAIHAQTPDYDPD